MKKNIKNISAMLREFREWNRLWDEGGPAWVNSKEFVKILSKKFSVKIKKS